MRLLDYVWACRPAVRIRAFAHGLRPHHASLPAPPRPVGRSLRHSIRHWALHPIRNAVQALGGACRWVPFMVAAGIGAAAPAPTLVDDFGSAFGVPLGIAAAVFGGSLPVQASDQGGDVSGGPGGAGGSPGGPSGEGSARRSSGEAILSSFSTLPATALAYPAGSASSLLSVSFLGAAPYAPLGIVSPAPALPYLFVPAAVPAQPVILSSPIEQPAFAPDVQKPAPIAPVPEPSTLALLIGAAFLFVAFRLKSPR